jgi:hypothetical protein
MSSPDIHPETGDAGDDEQEWVALENEPKEMSRLTKP